MDNLDRVFQKFYGERTASLWERFPGHYRALVVETNDPLQIYRIRFKCPELHDENLKPEQCPWAVPAPWLGGKNAGSWAHPCIGDIVWITWEKNHPYGPIWVGFATPTRRKYYPLESIYTKSPLSVKLDETADNKPNDYLETYLPKDFRPMSTGHRDRYGSTDIFSSIGFYPVEHKEKPATLGQDALSNKNFDDGNNPQTNNPDRKYLARVSKYGTYIIQSDIGYMWKKPEKEEKGQIPVGEFLGDFEKDRDFEIKRTNYLTRLFNEDKQEKPNPNTHDQRRYEVRTRAGHKFEMRDVGWAQAGGGLEGYSPVLNAKSRDKEYDAPRVLSNYGSSDERWLKLRSKGGHIVQMMDMGYHPEEDNFYKRLLKEEIGAEVDGEREYDWIKRDARQLRMLTRWGTKIVLDDRGTDPREAEKKEKPRANGWLFKTRRSWETEPATPRGFGFEANDKDKLNTTRWYTPKSKIIEMNDRKDYTLICTDAKGDITREWKGLKENEFALKIAMTENPEKDTYHLKLDKFNGYLRLKTAAGGDNGRRSQPDVFEPAGTGLNQGLEARDGRYGVDGAWTEVVDLEHRGLWLTKKEKMGIWRSKQGKDQFIMINDGSNTVIIRNNEDGPMQIFCLNDVQIISKRNISMKADKQITLKAGERIVLEAGRSGHAALTGSAWLQDVPVQSGSLSPLDPQPINQTKREPDDRGDTSNGPFPEISEEVVKGEV